MSKKSWGIYVFHYLPLACVAYYLRSFTSELPEGIVYIVVGISAFAGHCFCMKSSEGYRLSVGVY